MHYDLWSRVLRAIYGDHGFLNRKLPSRRSTWIDIIKSITYLQSKGVGLLNCFLRKVGDGAHTLFWKDLWIGDRPLKFIFPRLYALENEPSVSIDSK